MITHHQKTPGPGAIMVAALAEVKDDISMC